MSIVPLPTKSISSKVHQASNKKHWLMLKQWEWQGQIRTSVADLVVETMPLDSIWSHHYLWTTIIQLLTLCRNPCPMKSALTPPIKIKMGKKIQCYVHYSLMTCRTVKKNCQMSTGEAKILLLVIFAKIVLKCLCRISQLWRTMIFEWFTRIKVFWLN